MRKRSLTSLVGQILGSLALAGLLACGGSEESPQPSVNLADLPPLPELTEIPVGDEAAKQLAAYEERLRQSPTEGGLNGGVAMLLHSQERLEEAELMYRRVRLLVPTAARWAYLHGVVLEEMGRRHDAVAAYKDALERDEKNAPTMWRLARLHLEIGEENSNEALQAEGKNLLTQLLAANSEFAAAHYEMAQLMADEGNLETAVNHYEQALEHGASFGEGHERIAEIYAELGEERLAERHRGLAAKRSEVEPRFQDRWMSEVKTLGVPDWDAARKGEELVRLGMFRAAAPAFENAVALDPEDTESRVNLTAIYGLLGKPREAQRHYEELASQKDSDPRAHLNMGTIALGTRQWDTAIRYYKKAIAADPFIIKAYIGLSRAYRAKGSDREALRQLETAVKRNQYYTASLVELGQLLVQQGRYDEGIERLQQAVLYSEVQETLPVMRSLAKAYHDAGDQEQAIATLEEAREEAKRRDDNVTAVLIRSQMREYGAL